MHSSAFLLHLSLLPSFSSNFIGIEDNLTNLQWLQRVKEILGGYKGEDVKGMERWVEEWFEREDEIERGMRVAFGERREEEKEVNFNNKRR